MLFGKKKKKLDARVRFQHSSFTKKLDTARNYKRQSRALPERRHFNILQAIGLRSWWSKLLALAVSAGIIYLVFIPNFLFVKAITVNGVDGDLKTHVSNLTTGYFQESRFYDPQRNLLFLRSRSLARYIGSQDSRVAKVTVKRNFFKRSLTVNVESKYVAYIVNRTISVYGLYNDGTVKETEAANPDDWLNSFPGTLKIKDSQIESLRQDQQYFSPELMNVVSYLGQHFKETTNQDISYIELPEYTGALPMQFVVHVPKNLPKLSGTVSEYEVIVDPKMDLQLVFDKLNLLLTQTAPDRYRALKYIDMRFGEKGFVCLLNAPCAASPVSPEPAKPADTPASDQPATINQKKTK